MSACKAANVLAPAARNSIMVAGFQHGPGYPDQVINDSANARLPVISKSYSFHLFSFPV